MKIYKWIVDGILDESQSNLISRSLRVNFLVDQLSDISHPMSHSRNAIYFKSIPSHSLQSTVYYYNRTTSTLIYAFNIFKIFTRLLFSSNSREIYYISQPGIANINHVYPFVFYVRQ